MRELREFRVHHAEYIENGLDVAGITLDTLESNQQWAERLELPYPLLSDEKREAGNAFGIIRRIGIADWGVEFFRRSTFLIDTQGIIAAVWGSVKVRGHAREVLEAGRALGRIS